MALTGAERSKRMRERCKAKGLCITCGKNKTYGGYVTCSTCSKSVKPRMAKIRKRRSEAGLCCVCGENEPSGKGQYCRQCLDNRNKWYHQSNYKERRKAIRVKNRIDVINHYGGECACCGEAELCFLAIDHPNNNGKQERLKKGFGSSFYASLVKDGFPAGYRVLCHNCNFGRHLNGGTCPHKNNI